MSKFIFPLLIFIIGITMIMVIPKADLTHFLPFLENGWSPIIEDSFYKLSFPFGETIVFLAFLNTVKEKNKASKIYLKTA